MDFPANKTSELTDLNPKTIQDWYRYIRKAIATCCETEKQELFSWEIEMDESYFWPSRVRGKRWR